ncbi:MAG: hypothetical protein M3Y56_13190 [Armatimonadota bacterium]|nr:hypothetical protein [Armatimonadota bacterium]
MAPYEEINESETARDGGLPAVDQRAERPPRDVDTPRNFPVVDTLDAWEACRACIRQQILVSCGLYPPPAKAPLAPTYTSLLQRDGYSIENVYFQTFPGFYLAGNLYRPQPSSRFLNGTAAAPYPGVLVAHGHFPDGRFKNGREGSIPARAITFARQGYVAFTYDMVGFNDTRQINHKFANDRQHWLWGLSLMGLQTLNSLCALDFLSSLPDVDRERLAMTGESGGGTQTMILGAIDDRLAAVGPCVMVSHSYQGGCLCENAPGLRIDYSNMEIAAAAAPKFQVMVGATGDWTKTMLEVEGPAVKQIYDLYRVPDRLDYSLFPYDHNINQESREAVYASFGRHLLGEPDRARLKEYPYEMEPVEALQVFPPGAPLPADAPDAEAFTARWIVGAQQALESRKPVDQASLESFREVFYPAWRHTLGVEIPITGGRKSASFEPEFIAPRIGGWGPAMNSGSFTPSCTSAGEIVAVEGSPETVDGVETQPVNMGRRGRGDNIPGRLFRPANTSPDKAVILVHPQGITPFLNAETGGPGPLVSQLLNGGRRVLVLEPFLTNKGAAAATGRDDAPFGNYFTTYNRTLLQERVQDVITAVAFLRSAGDQEVMLAGFGAAGLWTLLAAPAADGVAADCNSLDLRNDEVLCSDEWFVPGLRRMGDFRTAAILAAPHPLLLHNTGSHFNAAPWIADVYHSLGVGDALRVEEEKLGEDGVGEWLVSALINAA